jgi:quinol-cytochrome oxidoreductase complex cytochrome b subunit
MFPAKVSRASLAWKYSFWLGTASAALFLLLNLSGLPLLFLYVPSVERAYASIKDIEYVVTFGSWLRSVHRVGAHLMVVVVALHLVRVFLTGAYKNGVGQGQRREWNWVIGVFMLLLTLLLSFTGYLLPWDQLAMWAITVGSNMARATPFLGNEGPGAAMLALGDISLVSSTSDARFALLGGTFVGESALLRFYVLHCVGIPLVAGFLMAVHFWRIRRDGGISGPL